MKKKRRDKVIHLGAGHVLRLDPQPTTRKAFALLDLRPSGARQVDGLVSAHTHVALNKRGTEELFCRLAFSVGWDTSSGFAGSSIVTNEDIILRVRREDLGAVVGIHFGDWRRSFTWIFADLPFRPLQKGLRELAPELDWELA